MLTTGNQLKAARALIGMEQKDAAEAAGVHVNTIRSMEAAGTSAIAGRAQNVQSVQRALEAAGIEFLNHGSPGVRLKLSDEDLALLRSGSQNWTAEEDIKVQIHLRSLEARGLVKTKLVPTEPDRTGPVGMTHFLWHPTETGKKAASS